MADFDARPLLMTETASVWDDANLHFATDVPPELLERFADFSASTLVAEEHIVIHHGTRVDANIVNIAMRILRLVHALPDDLPKTVCDSVGAPAQLRWLGCAMAFIVPSG